MIRELNATIGIYISSGSYPNYCRIAQQRDELDATIAKD
jgi:hypothetical protein